MSQEAEDAFWEFPGGLVVGTPACFHCCGPGLIPGGGTKIPPATQHSRGGGEKKEAEVAF